mgnify:CR=1 FL=1
MRLVDKYRGHVRAARMLCRGHLPTWRRNRRKIARRPAACAFFLVARQRPIRRPLAPVAGTAGQPFEGWVIGSSLEHPGEKIAIVGRKTQFGTIRHDPRQGVERPPGQDAAPLMAPLRPRIGKQDEDTADRRRRKRGDQQPPIIGENSDIFDAAALDPREQLCDPVFEYLATDQTDLGMTLCLVSEVLPAAKPDLNPDRPSPGIEEAAGIELARRPVSSARSAAGNRGSGLLPRPERPPAAPTEEKRAPCGPDSQSLRRRAAAPQRDQPLPGEAAVRLGRTTEMAVSRRARIDRLVRGRDVCGCRAATDPLVPAAPRASLCSSTAPAGVDIERQRLGNPDRVGDLDCTTLGKSRADDVLCEVAGGVGGRTVDLGRVLAGERAAAMRRRSRRRCRR